MKFCGKCGSELVEGNVFCMKCGTKIEDYTVEKPQTVQDESHTSDPNTAPPQATQYAVPKVNVKGGRYTGSKWFIKLQYKTYETDVTFSDTEVSLSQGSGFSKVSNKIPTKINYKDIYGVEAKKNYSIPNVVFAVIVAITAIATEIWVALLIAALAAWMGKTAIVSIRHSYGTYTVPTEFLSDAEELRDKINTAMRQAVN